jgi:hypothetical protein
VFGPSPSQRVGGRPPADAPDPYLVTVEHRDLLSDLEVLALSPVLEGVHLVLGDREQEARGQGTAASVGQSLFERLKTTEGPLALMAGTQPTRTLEDPPASTLRPRRYASAASRYRVAPLRSSDIAHAVSRGESDAVRHDVADRQARYKRSAPG